LKIVKSAKALAGGLLAGAQLLLSLDAEMVREDHIGLLGPDIIILDYRTINLIMSFSFGLNLDVMSLDVSWT
jgi:hypothetical protein